MPKGSCRKVQPDRGISCTYHTWHWRNQTRNHPWSYPHSLHSHQHLLARSCTTPDGRSRVSSQPLQAKNQVQRRGRIYNDGEERTPNHQTPSHQCRKRDCTPKHTYTQPWALWPTDIYQQCSLHAKCQPTWCIHANCAHLPSPIRLHEWTCVTTHTKTCHRNECTTRIMEKAKATTAMLILPSGKNAQTEQSRSKRLHRPWQPSVIMDP